jgi:A/G-specific adenine glycosylase
MTAGTLDGRMIKDFRSRLLRWFDAHARALPWRQTQDPYRIWISEIMLQQTRVQAVLEHYARFISLFPTIEALALAPEADVLAVWSGLGYYRRARMLHHASHFVMENFQGNLPRTAHDLRKLPGIGEYTSAAIASIAFGEKIAAVDGNVERVITRVRGLCSGGAVKETELRPRIREISSLLVDPKRPGDFNQAMMELGATVCLPRRPLCLGCPVEKRCQTRGEHPQSPRKQMLSEPIAYALVTRESKKKGTEVLMEQRSETATVMPKMWELPKLTDAEVSEEETVLVARHAIMNTNYYVRVRSVQAGDLATIAATRNKRRWANEQDLQQLPLTGFARKALRRLQLLPPERKRDPIDLEFMF